MLRQNEYSINFTDVLKIIFRWKKVALYSFLVFLFVYLFEALSLPLKYESQVILERKPAKISSQEKSPSEEFDISRLTSEIQRNVALLKSRAMIETWMEAIGLSPNTPRKKEKYIKKLYRSLTVQPINYTDLFILKVKATSPEEAIRRASLLADVYTEWDAKQNREEAQELTRLLQERQRQNRINLSEKLTALKLFKSRQSISLSGSNTEKELEENIAAQNKLLDLLSLEMEEAERRLGDSTRRIHVLAPPKVIGEPVHSRFLLIVMAVCASGISVFLLIFLLEWLDCRVHQANDIHRIFPSDPVYLVPRFNEGANIKKEMEKFLDPVRDTIIDVMNAKGSTLVQVSSSNKGSGQTSVCLALAQLLRTETKVCLLRRSSHDPVNGTVTSPLITDGIPTFTIDRTSSVKKYVKDLQGTYNVFLLDKEPIGENLPGSDIVELTDITCLIVVGGLAQFSFLKYVRRQLEHIRDRKIIFILNRYINPLPKWLHR